MDVCDAADRISRCFPELRHVVVEKAGEGLDNFAFEVNGEYIFRFPKHEEGVKNLRSEMTILPKLKDLSLPLQIPESCYSSFDPPIFGYKKIVGNSACSVMLTDQDRTNMAKPFAAFLKAVHAIGISQAQEWGLKITDGERTNPEKCLAEIDESLKKLGMDVGTDFLRKPLTFARQFPRRLRGKRLCFIHGDLYARHLILGQKSNLIGVIDWGDADLADPAIDLQCVFLFFPPEGQRAFCDLYGAIGYEEMMLVLVCRQFDHPICTNLTRAFAPI